MVVKVVATAITPVDERSAVTSVVEIFCFASMMADRNNEIIYLIAKYFLRFLHELTVISGVQTSAPDKTIDVERSQRADLPAEAVP